MREARRFDVALADPRVARVFDGAGFRDERESGLTVTPGLIDAGAGIAGYRERLTDPLLQAPRAVLRLLVESGIAGLRVASSSWSEYSNFRGLLSEAGADVLSVTGGGPLLTDAEPTSDRQRWITSADELRRAVAVVGVEGVGWVAIQTDQREFASEAIRVSHHSGLRVALRAPASIAQPLRTGDLFVGVGNLTRRSVRDRALDILMAWGEDGVARVLDHAMALAERGVGLTSELLSLYRNVFVREALDAPFLEENIPILPHVKWLLQMRRGAGYIAGRSALREHTGLAEPTRAESALAKDGWARLLEATGRLAEAGVRILPASTAPQMTQLPGFALKEELGAMLQAGVPLTTLLATATDFAWLGLPVSGSLLASTVPPSDPVRFVAGLTPLR